MCYVFSENENESNQIVLLVLKCSSSSAFLVEKACHVMWCAVLGGAVPKHSCAHSVVGSSS